ncbi:hypothetical protein M5D96_003988 [Drosophila gunungcola]|uniref:Uncharacterized protein n=1 Tax=Drosophila gunungcola TaxID=103775 RepID=A0A9P9YTA0_9MUSC|nr:hypothetical protein M5D96_003988 [Drosophila gunungcola]
MNPSKNLPTISQPTSSSDTESADIKATSTATATTTMGGVGVSAEEEETVNEQENPQQQQQQQQQQKKAKRLPAFAAAILKRFNEKDSRKNKDNQESMNIVEACEQENPAGNNAIDGNDNEPKQDKQLVYAELVLKPANEATTTATPAPTAKTTTAATTPEGTGVGAKSSTEYAEIVYVQKGGESKK